MNHLLVMLASAVGISGIVGSISLVFAKKIVAEIHSVDNRIPQPIRGYAETAEEDLFSALRAHQSALAASAARFGVPTAVAAGLLAAMTKAESENPFTVPAAAAAPPAPSPSPAPVAPPVPVQATAAGPLAATAPAPLSPVPQAGPAETNTIPPLGSIQ